MKWFDGSCESVNGVARWTPAGMHSRKGPSIFYGNNDTLNRKKVWYRSQNLKGVSLNQVIHHKKIRLEIWYLFDITLGCFEDKQTEMITNGAFSLSKS